MKKFHVVIVMTLLIIGASALRVPAALAQAGTTNGCSGGAVDGGDGNCYNMDTSQVVGTVQTSSGSGGTGFVALAPIPGLTDAANTSVVNQTSLANFFNNLYKYAIGLAATLAVIMIIWGGLEISTKDSVSKQSDGRERIYQAIIGLVLVLSPVLVFSIINPAILNLSINLPKLDTKSSGTVSSPAAQPAQLSNVDTQLRQGVQVLDTFTIPSANQVSIVAKKNFLDAQQVSCTAKSGGLGIIMPVTGDAGKYVCQTCPPNTSPALYAPGRSPDSPRGTCNPN